MITTINPATGETLESYVTLSSKEIEAILEKNQHAFQLWRKESFTFRSQKMQQVSEYLLNHKKTLAEIITTEMGKLPSESIAEIEKCALVAQYFAEHAEKFLANRPIKTDKTKSYVTYTPLGTILAIMPWNFPFWQVFRFATPALMAGNAALLKHSPNTTASALAIEKIFKDTGFPSDLFRTLVAEDADIDKLIKHPNIAAVTLTGSIRTGSLVAKEAGSALKKLVLELGGSDPYLILEDADLELASECIIRGRMMNAGQSCIAPKRILIVSAVYGTFKKLILEKMSNFTLRESHKTNQKSRTIIGPLARKDLRDQLENQVQNSIAKGATLLMGGIVPPGPGFFYPPTVLADIKKGMPAYEEELFGPVISLIEVKDEQEAIQVANATRYGLGAAVFTQDLERGEKIAAEQIESGACFVNDVVTSDPRLPFGGIKSSGFGRELSEEGIKEFVNIKTIVVR